MPSNLPAGFIDLATFEELEAILYGGPMAYTPFVRANKKSTWFTVMPATLTINSGNAEFNTEWSVRVTRAGDYMLHNWLRIELPSVSINTTGNAFGVDGRLRWTRNLMHNLVEECSITFNDLRMGQINNFHLDFWSAFTVPAGKRNGYDNMIGNVAILTNPIAVDPTSGGITLPAATLNLPLPLPHTRDSGVSLPTAALPYNDIAINFRFRNWSDLLLLDNISTATTQNATSSDITTTPTISGRVTVWANYAIVSNDERRRMGKAPRDILIEQAQHNPAQTWTPGSSSQFNIRFSHAVKVLFFAARNRTVSNEWSNYTAASPVPSASGVDFSPSNGADPWTTISIYYENTPRLNEVPVDYYTLVAPFYHAVSIPLETGYHMYSYALRFIDIDPTGSTNHGKITLVSFLPVTSTAGTVAGNGTGAALSGASTPQVFSFILTGVNNNLVRVSGGALGFPIL